MTLTSICVLELSLAYMWWSGEREEEEGEGRGEQCRVFCSVPGPLQTVQRDELLGLFLLSML